MHSPCVRSMSEVIELLLRESVVGKLETQHPARKQEPDTSNEHAVLVPELHRTGTAADLQ